MAIGSIAPWADHEKNVCSRDRRTMSSLDIVMAGSTAMRGSRWSALADRARFGAAFDGPIVADAVAAAARGPGIMTEPVVVGGEDRATIPPANIGGPRDGPQRIPGLARPLHRRLAFRRSR